MLKFDTDGTHRCVFTYNEADLITKLRDQMSLKFQGANLDEFERKELAEKCISSMQPLCRTVTEEGIVIQAFASHELMPESKDESRDETDGARKRPHYEVYQFYTDMS